MESIKTAATYVVLGICVLVLCACALCQEDEAEVLRLIIEKAREREAALERADLKYSGTGASVQAVAPIGVAFRGRYRKSQDMYRHGVQARVKGPGMEQSMKVDMVSDGDTLRMLGEQGDGNSFGNIQKRTEGFGGGMPTPEHIGVTRLFGTPGTLSEYLEADKAQLSEKYGDRFTAGDAIMETTLRGTEKLGERDCVVVECFANPQKGSETVVNRLYFAPDLDYACVKFDVGRPSDDGMNVMFSMEFGDFREVMEGVFIPFEVSGTGYDQNGQVQGTVECKVESLEFPETFDENVFTLTFPDGMTLWDSIAGVSYTVGGGGPQGGTTEDMLLEMVAEAMIPEEEPPAPVVETPEPVTPPPVEAPTGEPEQAPSGPPIAILALLAALILGAATAALLAARRRKTRRD